MAKTCTYILYIILLQVKSNLLYTFIVKYL